MADSTTGRLAAALVGPGRRGTAAVVLVGAMALGSHVVAPAVVPEYAVYAQYATYLVAFSVWMAWFVDWLAVWLGKDHHPDDDGEGPAGGEGGADDPGRA